MTSKHKWEWLYISPDVFALSGTPFRIRQQDFYNQDGELIRADAYCIYEYNEIRKWSMSLRAAQFDAELLAGRI